MNLNELLGYTRTAPVSTPPARRPTCVHLGPVRNCCPDLHICLKDHDAASTLQDPHEQPGVKCCATCSVHEPREHWAPVRGSRFVDRPWEGPWTRKPWDHDVTVVIPVLDMVEAATTLVDAYRMQYNRPYIVIVDTGSKTNELSSLAAPDVEVHTLRLNGVRHPSDFPAIAMDLAFSACQTPYLIATHVDCFPMSRSLTGEMIEYCKKGHPVAGYGLTKRDHSDWNLMVGHTMTVFDMAHMDRINASWSLRRLVATREHPDGKRTAHSPAMAPNWPDTELLINYQCMDAGIKPLIIAHEQGNCKRTTDDRIDHCRSVTSATLYDASSEFSQTSSSWLADGIKKCRERIEHWRTEC